MSSVSRVNRVSKGHVMFYNNDDEHKPAGSDTSTDTETKDDEATA